MKLTKLLVATLALTAFSASAEIPEGYYDACIGKKQSALKSQLYTIIKSHDKISYGSSGTWGAFRDTDVRDNGYIWDIYTDDEVAMPSSGSASGMNIEHTFPKSWWGGSKNDAYCDIMHLMPVNATVNSRRSNHPYAEVSSASWENTRSKVGKPKSGQGGGASTVFEPDDEYKGDLARTYFYMVTCYQNLSWQGNGLLTAANGTYPTLQDWAIEMLLDWHRNDPVSQKELDRNEAVYYHQGNRNPFIDHPDMVEYIWGTMQATEWTEEGGVLPPPSKDPVLTSPLADDVYNLGAVAYGEYTQIEIPVLGTNFSHTATATIKGTDAEMFSLIFANTEMNALTLTAKQINSVTGHVLKVRYTPTSITADDACHSATIELTSADLATPITVYLQGSCYELEDVASVVALDATDITDDGYTANWLASTQHIDYYTVYRNIWDENGSEVIVTEEYEVDPSATSLAITGRMSDCKETYTVTASMNGIESPHSNLITIEASSAIDMIDTDGSAAVYYTPSGVRLDSRPTAAGVYIVRQGLHTSKITIR